LRRLRQRFPDELVVIGVHSAKFPSEKLTENIRAAVMRHAIQHPIINDAGFSIWNAYAVHAWPTLVLIDPHGRIASEQSGEILAEDFIPAIEKMIKTFDDLGDLDRRPLDLTPASALEPEHLLSFPARLLVDPSRSRQAGELLYIADSGHNRILELRLQADGLQAEVLRSFGSGDPTLRDGLAGSAAFHDPHGLALSGKVLYVADTGNHAIRAIELETGSVNTLAGTGEKAHGVQPGGALPTETRLRSPWAILPLEIDQDEAMPLLFIAMAGSHQIWLLLDEERIGIFAGNGREDLIDGPTADASFNQPCDLTLGMSHLLVADAEASAIRAISLTDKPQVLTLVGQGLFEFGDVDGSGAEARLQHPTGIFYHEGLIYIADSYNHKIKTLDPTTGKVSTIIGTGKSGRRDGAFEQAEFFEPEGIAISGSRLYIADTNNHLIRVADMQTGLVQTLSLRGLERLPAPATQAAPGQRLEALRVAPGPLSITLDIQLPAGYEFNPEVCAVLQIGEPGDRPILNFPAPPFTFELEAVEDQELSLDLTVYYCRIAEARLCLVDNRRLLLPLTVRAGAPTSARLPYTVVSPLREDPS
jgi:DNA-binding beta-propeller fold protein YncE